MPYHNDEVNLATQVAQSITRGAALGYITDAIVSASTSRQSLINNINAVATHNDATNFKILISNVINRNPNITDAAVNSATTVAGLLTLVGITNPGQASVLN